MTVPLIVLAAFAVLLGVIGTPAWPWFHSFLSGHSAELDFGRLSEAGVVPLMALSTVIVFAGLGLGWWLYGRKPIHTADEKDVLETARPDIYLLLVNKYFVDEFYEATVIRFNAWCSRMCDWLDRWIWNGAAQSAAYLVLGLSWLSRFIDEYLVNLGFDRSCRRLRTGGGWLSRFQNGQVQNYLRVFGVALTVLVLVFLWGCKGS